MRDHLDEFGLAGAILSGETEVVTACSVFPPVVSAATGTRLRFFGDRLGPLRSPPIDVDDAEAYAVYADPANGEPAAGSARRVRPRPVRYDPHVSVRFSREMVEQVGPSRSPTG